MFTRGVHTSLLFAACLVVFVLATTGCPFEKNGKVMVLLSSDAGAKAIAGSSIDKDLASPKAGEVPLDDIASLTVVVTEISLDTAEADGAEGEGEGEGESDGGSVIVFSGEKEVDLRDLTGISELISAGSVSAGHYTKIRLAVKDPKLELVSDPGVFITDIQLTANGHLFVSESFDVPANQTSLILLDFQGLHLVETGQGKYVWTPQLRAAISVEAADVVVTGTIEAVDAGASTLTVNVGAGSDPVEVDYSGAAIYLLGDTDTPHGTPADLTVGTAVTIEGTLEVTGPVQAATIRITG